MIDQLFVDLKHWLVTLAPGWFQPFLSAIISIAALIGAFASLFALTTVLERKGLAASKIATDPTVSAHSDFCSLPPTV